MTTSVPYYYFSNNISSSDSFCVFLILEMIENSRSVTIMR